MKTYKHPLLHLITLYIFDTLTVDFDFHSEQLSPMVFVVHYHIHSILHLHEQDISQQADVLEQLPDAMASTKRKLINFFILWIELPVNFDPSHRSDLDEHVVRLYSNYLPTMLYVIYVSPMFSDWDGRTQDFQVMQPHAYQTSLLFVYFHQ